MELLFAKEHSDGVSGDASKSGHWLSDVFGYMDEEDEADVPGMIQGRNVWGLDCGDFVSADLANRVFSGSERRIKRNRH
jgi:hypothetical protein